MLSYEGRRLLSKEGCRPTDRGRGAEGELSPGELSVKGEPPGRGEDGAAPELCPRRAACACACAGLQPRGEGPSGCAAPVVFSLLERGRRGRDERFGRDGERERERALSRARYRALSKELCLERALGEG